MSTPAWIQPQAWTVHRAGRADLDMTVDQILTELARQGCDAISRTQVEYALEMGDQASANMWLAASGAGIRVRRQTPTATTAN